MLADLQFVSGSDDFQLRVYNISTGEKITSFEAHPDYIRCLTVHPTLSLVLTGSDDMTIKCWDWEKGWRCVNVSLRAPSTRPLYCFGEG
jgi:coatomer subunit beta'